MGEEVIVLILDALRKGTWPELFAFIVSNKNR